MERTTTFPSKPEGALAVKRVDRLIRMVKNSSESENENLKIDEIRYLHIIIAIW